MTSLEQYFPFLFYLGTLVICLFAGPLSRRLRVVDYPDGARKGHETPTPLIGGIAVMIPLALWCLTILLMRPEQATALHRTVLLCGLGVAVMGFMDDQAPVSPRSRFILLVIFAVMAIALDPGLIGDHLYWSNGTATALPFWAFCALIVVSQVGLVSAINMTDGMNGLVPTLYLVWFFSLALITVGAVQTMALLVCGMLIITLLFNVRGRLFLGDCGTFAITFVLGVLVIAAHKSGRIAFDQMLIWFFIPVVDCLRLTLARLMRGRSPFLGDTNHFHHRLIQRFGQDAAFVLYLGSVVGAVATATLWPSLNVITFAALLTFYFGFLLPRPGQAAAKDNSASQNVVRLRDQSEKRPLKERK